MKKFLFNYNTDFPLKIIFISILIFCSSCVKKGCTDSDACNYNSSATRDDGTCNYGCYDIGSSSGGSSSGGSSSGGSSSGGYLCTNTCTYAYDGVCDDGGSGSSYSVCDYGTDCNDCGSRPALGGSSSGGSSSGSSSGGSSYGRISFYTTSDFGCGNISVTVSGEGTQYITGYYSSGISGCNNSSCAEFTLPPGTYNYSASCDSYTWNNSFTITEDGCLKYQLYL